MYESIKGVCDQVSAHRYEFCIVLPGPHSLQAGLQEGVRRVDTARMAALLERGKGLLPRNALLCQLNSYSQPNQEGAA